MIEVLKRDPKAMEIFMDELALADKTQPKHMRFLANLPKTQQSWLDTASNGPASASNTQYNIQNQTFMFNFGGAAKAH